MLNRIPDELKALAQWVCADKNKKPVDPNTNRAASPTNPNTWSSFEMAKSKISPELPHIGFVLTANDPYCIIDLDDPMSTKKDWSDDKRTILSNLNQKITSLFNTYTEISQSGTGLHIINKGSIPKGVNRDTVEIYSSERYIICTGNILKNFPILENQYLLTQLYNEMEVDSKSNFTELTQVESKYTDPEIMEMASGAINAEKFNRLCSGIWVDEFTSQSEADLALLSILAFYTKDNEQVRRIFRCSPLGKREKAVKNDVYLNRTLVKIRAHELPPIDFTAVQEKVDQVIDSYVKSKKEEPLPTQFLFPPGLIGDMADYIYKSAVRPVPEVALIASIGLLAGIVGRQYNISGTGLNQYLILLAETGTGKEGAANGIDKLINAVRTQIPFADQFQGPAAFASGPALVKTLAEKKCFISTLGEFGLTLQQICDPRANGASITLRQALLDLYQKSGWHSTVKASAYSDKAKNTEIVRAPALTILGESTPSTFIDGLDEYHIADGLIPRFMIVEYTGKRPYLNKNCLFEPPSHLINRLSNTMATVVNMDNNHVNCPVLMEPPAEALAGDFETWTTDVINSDASQVHRHLWNRAHLKALKLAALVSVGINHERPIITLDVMVWSIDFVKRDVAVLLTRFKRGEVGVGENKQLTILKGIIVGFLSQPKKGAWFKFYSQKVIPRSFLQQRTASKSVFKTDKRGSSMALNTVILSLIASGELMELTPQDMKTKFNSTQKGYAIGNDWSLDEIEE